MFKSLHLVEMDWLYSLQFLHSPALDLFFKGLNLFDRMEFYFVVTPFLWYFLSPLWALRFFTILITNAQVNGFLKEIFMQPRPSFLDSQLGLLPFTGYGMPSGSAQLMCLLLCIVMKECSLRIRVCSCLLFLLLSFSRVYLGAHFFSDVLAGWLVGFILAYLFYKTHEKIEGFLCARPKESLLFFTAALVILTAFIPTKLAYLTTALGLGGGCGLLFLRDLTRGAAISPLLASLATIFSLFLLYGGSTFLSAHFPAYALPIELSVCFLMGFSATFLLPWLFQKVVRSSDSSSCSGSLD